MLSCRYRLVSAHSSSALPDDLRYAVTRLRKAVNVKRVALGLAGAGLGTMHHKKVARLMRQAGIARRHQRRRR